ncbi:target of Nesh-SH3 isoform X5 [Eleutherodactylus coqui]|uniref:target of Nesh-SH3 isoform X5 n=1 Tax=Eleutherodactylus coqui TaxID=57060 RepID=UPI003461B4E5
MISRLSLLLFCGTILAHLGDAQKLPKVKKLNMKAHINITGDTLIMKFHRPNQNIKLEGFILGYGSNYFTNQYIQWPENGKSYITDVDAETRYLIAVKPNDNPKKSCQEKNSAQKPLQLVIGTLSPTSVFLSWGILINPQIDWSALNKCPNDRFYTVRYREKNKDWLFQLCPTTETVIENLKPYTVYEFGVKVNSEDEIWSKSQTHKTNSKGKENGNSQSTYKTPKGTLQYATEDTKAFIPVTKVKQGFQNVTKFTPAPPPTGKSPDYKDKIKKPYVETTTARLATPKPKPVSKITESPPLFKPSDKPAVEDPKPVPSQPIVESFTPDSSTGTLEWVRATMVTHPYFQVTNIPVESPATDGHTAPLVVVKGSDGRQDESTGIATLEPALPVDPPKDILVSPTIASFLFSKGLPFQQPGTVLATQDVAMKMSPGYPSSTYEVHPVATDVPQVSPLFPLKKYLSTLAADEKQSINVPTKMSIFEKPQIHDATTRQIIPARQSTPPSHTRKKTTTAFTGDQHIHATFESVTRTEVPPSVSATASQTLPAKQRTRPPRIQTKTTTALPRDQYVHTTFESITRTEVPRSVSAATTQIMPAKQRTVPSHPRTKTTTATASQIFSATQMTLPTHSGTKTTMAFTGSMHASTTQDSIVRTETPYSIHVPSKTTSFHPKTFPSTEASNAEADSTQPDSEINTTEAPHTYEPETFTLASHDKTLLKFSSTSKPKTTTASKKTRVSPVQHKTPLPEKTHPTAVATETQKLIPKKIHTTENSFLPVDPKTSQILPTDNFGVDIFQHSKITFAPKSPQKVPINFIHIDIPGEPDVPSEKTETQTISPPIPKPTQADKMLYSKPAPKPPQKVPINFIHIHIPGEPDVPSEKTETQTISPPIPKPTQADKMLYSKPAPKPPKKVPINFIHIHIPEEPDVPSEKTETQTISPPIPKPTQADKMLYSKPAPKPPQKVPINFIHIHIPEEPDVPSEKTETQTISPPIPKPTQADKMLYSKPAPKSTQKVPINFIHIHIPGEPDVPLVPNTTQRPYQPTTTQKPESPPHSKPVPTQKLPKQITKKPKPTPRTRVKPAPYRLPNSSPRPKTSLRPRTRPPALNRTTQGPIRSKPTEDFNFLPGTITGENIYDNTKLLGVSRNISMEPNTTRRRAFSVSSPPHLPVRPTSIRRRIPHTNVTGRPGVSVSSPPLLPVRPTSIHRKPPATNVPGRPANKGDILIPRAPSAAKPECKIVCIKSTMKQPTLPAQEEDLVDSTVFSPAPKSDIDALGKTRFIVFRKHAETPHVVYVSKNDSVPCSITETLQHFPTQEEDVNQEITGPPQNPPTNLTVVTVEGCSSFVVLNWTKPDNDSATEYNVISKENGGLSEKDQSIITTNQTYSTVENLKPDTSYEFVVVPINPLGTGPSSEKAEFNTESADPRVSEPVTGGKDAIWTEIKFKADSYSDCKGKQYVKRTWYKKFVGIQLCNSLRYKIYLSDTLSGTFYNVGDQSGFGEDHCQFVDSFLEGRTGKQLQSTELDTKRGFYRSVRQQPVEFGEIGGYTHINYVHWYECGISIPGKW